MCFHCLVWLQAGTLQVNGTNAMTFTLSTMSMVSASAGWTSAGPHLSSTDSAAALSGTIGSSSPTTVNLSLFGTVYAGYTLTLQSNSQNSAPLTAAAGTVVKADPTSTVRFQTLSQINQGFSLTGPGTLWMNGCTLNLNGASGPSLAATNMYASTSTATTTTINLLASSTLPQIFNWVRPTSTHSQASQHFFHRCRLPTDCRVLCLDPPSPPPPVDSMGRCWCTVPAA
jgi:hypothetical protein